MRQAMLRMLHTWKECGSAALAAGIAGREEAYDALREILSRKEFQGWIDPFEYISAIFEKLGGFLTSLPRGIQFAIAAVLVAILVAIFVHWAMVLRRLYFSPREANTTAGEELASILRARLPPEKVKAGALEALEHGDAGEAVRLLYVYFVMLLRARSMLPQLSSLTAREITRLVESRLEGSDRAGRLFEKSAYSRHATGTDEAEWMLGFVEAIEGRGS